MLFRSGSRRTTRPPRGRSKPARTRRCDPYRGRWLICMGYRGCRFAQPPANFWSPSRGILRRKVGAILERDLGARSGAACALLTNRFKNLFHGPNLEYGAVRRFPMRSEAARKVTARAPAQHDEFRVRRRPPFWMRGNSRSPGPPGWPAQLRLSTAIDPFPVLPNPHRPIKSRVHAPSWGCRGVVGGT